VCKKLIKGKPICWFTLFHEPGNCFDKKKQVKSMLKNIAVVILAAGLGTRMKSDKAKVLHEVAERPMILYVVEVARKAAGDDIIMVVGHQAQKVREITSETARLHFVYQEKQLGTAHAVLCALPHIPDHCDDIVILSGDVPLILPETITGLIEDHLAGYRDISLLAVELENPDGYGRVLRDDSGQVFGIIEEKDATNEQKKIKLINAGIYCINKKFLQEAIPKIKSNNAQEEFYLTDIMAIGHKEKKKMGFMVAADYHQILGVNNCQDLEEADKIMKKRMRNIS
jgi:UDP-N-acetylglucosamine diphosphorylase/glucosamine-1-phosphate N-acetyltransferase